MSFSLTYGLLCEATILHNYFLNSGEETFAAMSVADKEVMLQKFNSDLFFTITPTAATSTLLRNYKMVFKRTKSGFKVYVKVMEDDETNPFISLPVDIKLEFLLAINDYQFENYTDLEFVLDQTFLFSNVKPATEPVTFKYISKIDDNEVISNDYLVSAATTTNILSELKTTERQNVFGIISLKMQGDANPKNIVNNLGKLLSPNFKIHFDNRKTFWKYINRTAAIEIETNTAKPLTCSGFVQIDPLTDFTPPEPANSQYPNPSVKSITKINSDYYSEIFI